jgi:hypothetical protein
MELKIAHIINPFEAGEASEMAVAQQITFESLRRAKSFSEGLVDVSFFSAQFEEDLKFVPEDFTKTPNLSDSILQESGIVKEQKLPFLKDILSRLYENTDADYLIYSNVDIGLMPQFYSVVKEIIDSGIDGFVINRRRVSGKYNSVDQLDQIYSESGALHNGFDCFVFKRSLYPKFNLGKVCVGIPHVGNTLAFNLMCFSEKFRLFPHKHLTFHLGYELVKRWGNKSYLKHNKQEYRHILKENVHHLKLINVPGASYPRHKRYFKWLMNPNFHFPTMLNLDIKQRGTKRYPLSDSEKQKRFLEWLQKKVKLDN